MTSTQEVFAAATRRPPRPPMDFPSVSQDLTAAVSLRDVRKRFGSAQILNGVTADIPAGAITTILGPSGTGKSVLLKHIMGLLDPDSGTVQTLGHDVQALPKDQLFELRKNLGVLFQDGALFGSMNVYDNVAFPLRRHTTKTEEEIREIVQQGLADVGLANKADRAPSELSGGMRKRAGFARALVMEPSLVMFDEPDSGLDPVRTELLCQLMLKLHAERGGAYLVITHDIETARTVSDYIGVLWKGKVLQFGPADEVFNSDEPLVRQFLHRSADGPLGMD